MNDVRIKWREKLVAMGNAALERAPADGKYDSASSSQPLQEFASVLVLLQQLGSPDVERLMGLGVPAPPTLGR